MDCVLLISNDQSQIDLFKEHLHREGLSVKAVSWNPPYQGFNEGSFDLIVVNVDMPGTGRFELLRNLRERTVAPILALVEEADEISRIVALEMGADDCLSKLVNPRELVARVHALRRRFLSGLNSSPTETSPTEVSVNGVTVNRQTWTVHCENRELALTALELNLLFELMQGAGCVLTRQYLIEKVLQRKFDPFDRSIDMHICNLRKKLGVDRQGRERIKTIRGAGYVFIGPQQNMNRPDLTIAAQTVP
jgi:two-component system, OmpR family, response regulator CpxR